MTLLLCAASAPPEPGHLNPEVAQHVVEFIISTRATTVSLGMYPPGSKTIQNSVEKVQANLVEVLKLVAEVTVSEVNGRLLIEGKQLEEKDQKRPPVVDFLQSMVERSISSITFKRGTSPQELIDFLVVVSKKPKEIEALGPIPDQLTKKGIRHIQLNERIFVATTEEEADMFEKRIDMMRDFLLAGIGDGTGGSSGMLGEEDDSPIDSEVLGELVGDRDMFVEAMYGTFQVDPFEGEDEDAFLHRQANVMRRVLGRSYRMYKQLEDEAVKGQFLEGVAETMMKFDSDVLGDMYLQENEQPTEMSLLGVEPVFYDNVEDEPALEMADYIIGEIHEFKEEAADYTAEERKLKVGGIKKTVKQMIDHTIMRDFFDDLAMRFHQEKLVKRETIDKLKQKAADLAEQGLSRAPLESEGLKLLKPDGSIDHAVLNAVINDFDSLTDGQIPGTVETLGEILGEVLPHPGLHLLVDKMLDRIDMERDFTLVYSFCTNFLEQLCRELMVSERFELSAKIISRFRHHADPENERDETQRKHAEKLLKNLVTPEVNSMLITFYQHAEDEVKARVQVLISVMGPAMMNDLMAVLKTSEDMKVRRSILQLMKNIGREILSAVNKELADESNPWYVTRNMLTLITEIQAEDQADRVKPYLQSGDPRVRKEAARALSKLNARKSAEDIRPLLNDKDIGVRRFVISTLGALKDVQSISAIGQIIAKRSVAVAEEEDAVQLEAIAALGRMRDREAVSHLLEAVKKEGIFSKNRTKTPEIRARAIWALSSYPLPEVKKAVKAAIKDSSQEVAEAAKTVLSRMGD